MSFSLGQLIGVFFLGGFCGIFVMALMFMAREDEQPSVSFKEVEHE